MPGNSLLKLGGPELLLYPSQGPLDPHVAKLIMVFLTQEVQIRVWDH